MVFNQAYLKMQENILTLQQIHPYFQGSILLLNIKTITFHTFNQLHLASATIQLNIWRRTCSEIPVYGEVRY